MEAVWTIEVEDFPAFIVVNDKGDDFSPRSSSTCVRHAEWLNFVGVI